MAYIYPKHGEEASIARVLLALADNPRDVATNSDNGIAFVVPEDLYQRYLKGTAVQDEDELSQPSGEIVRRRPGRPRKVQPAKEGD